MKRLIGKLKNQLSKLKSQTIPTEEQVNKQNDALLSLEKKEAEILGVDTQKVKNISEMSIEEEIAKYRVKSATKRAVTKKKAPTKKRVVKKKTVKKIAASKETTIKKVVKKAPVKKAVTKIKTDESL